MITEKTKNCAFYKAPLCKLLSIEPFDCDRCVAFHPYEVDTMAKELREYDKETRRQINEQYNGSNDN